MENNENMDNEKKEELTLKGKIKKYGLWILGSVAFVGAVVASAIYLSDKADAESTDTVNDTRNENDSVINTVCDEIEESHTTRAYTLPSESFPVKMHPRKLAEGKNPSAEKVEEMIKLGMNPNAGYTIVDGYQKNAS